MTDQSTKSLSRRIQEHYGEMSRTDRQIADLILSFPGEIASYSAVELAEMAKTSNAAVSRFVQKIGFRNFEEMRRHARDLKAYGSPIYLVERDAVSSLPKQVERHVAASLENISLTFDDIDLEVLSEAIEGIASARRVLFVGMRNGHFLAKYLRWQVGEVREQTELLPAAGETLGESLAGTTDKDLVVIFAIRRLVPSMRSLLQTVGTLKARTLIIADQYFAEQVTPTWVVKCSTRTRAPLDNHVAVLLLCHIIADELMQLLGAKGRRRLASIEDLHEVLGEM